MPTWSMLKLPKIAWPSPFKEHVKISIDETKKTKETIMH